MSSLPLVSYVVPSYNHFCYVEKTITSILNQDYPNIELIVLDDGSTDGSNELLEELSIKYGFYYEVHNNMGCAATLNKGFSIGSGKYFCALASDDWIVSNKTSIQVAYLEENPEIAVCGGNIIAVDEKENVLKKQRYANFRTLVFEDVFFGRKHGIQAPTAMIRKDVFIEVGGYDPAIILEDIYLWLKITKRGYPLAVLEDKLAFYRKHGSNIHYNHEFMLDQIEKVYEPYKSEENYDYIINKRRVNRLLAAAKAGNKRFAWETLKKVPFRYQSMKTFKALLHICKPSL